MDRHLSHIILWVLAVVVGITVVAGGALTVYIVGENNDARAARCADVVAERRGDRLLWTAIFRTFDDNGTSEAVARLRDIVDEFKPPLTCSDDHIPVEVLED